MRQRVSDGVIGLVCPGPNDYWLGGLHYLEHLVASISRLPPEERVPFCDVWWGEAPADDPFKDVRHLLRMRAVLMLPRTVGARLSRFVRRRYSGQSDKGMSDIFEGAGIDALFPSLPCARPGVPLIFWLTDLQYRHHPERYPEEMLRWFESFNHENGHVAARVVVTSQAVLDDVRRFLPQLVDKARVVKICSVPTERWWRSDPVAVARRYALPERFFVISNQICVHKNHQTVFDAVKRLRESGINVSIVCTGRNEDYRDPLFFPTLSDRVVRDGLESQVRFLGAVPREDHIALLRRSLALIQPSLFEGWGFAISDAKALGKPVLASDIPVHHEHGHPRITYVPPSDQDAWADALGQATARFAPGPDLPSEEEAAARSRVEALRAGRSAVEMFREVIG